MPKKQSPKGKPPRKGRKRPLAVLQPEPSAKNPLYPLGYPPEASFFELASFKLEPPSTPLPPSTPPPIQLINYAEVEAWAKQTLERAGIPFDGPGALYSLPGGFPPEHADEGSDIGTLVDLAESRGFRKRKTKEWFAAAILHQGPSASVDAKLDRLIEKAQVLIDPKSRRTIPGGVARGNQRQTASEEIRVKMQAAADDVWKRRPSYSSVSVAKMIQKKFPGYKVDTIRKKIQKPTP